jgi:homoaconitase
MASRLLSKGARAFATVVPRDAAATARITPPYQHLTDNLKQVRHILGQQPLTLAEKILYAHLADPEASLAGRQGNIRGEVYLKLHPDRVAMQDASAQMALLQFLTCGLPTSAVPASVHCDHLIVGHKGAEQDLKDSVANNKEIFDFLESASKKYGLQFWAPGSGIIHQIVLENYAAPGGMMLGTDSHTPNAGGLGMIAIGVGGADAVDAMTATPWELKAPKVIGVELTGKMQEWTSPKDLIMYLAGKLTVRGGTGHVIEYYGSGVETLSCTGMATVCNMGAEVGATTSLFPYSQGMRDYLHATRRGAVASAADKAHREHNYLQADADAQYDQVIKINLSELEPYINGPLTPDLATPLSKFGSAIQENGWPKELSVGLIGSCTNSSYEDMSRVADIIRQASAAGLKPKTPLLVTPGSEQIRATIERDGLTGVLESAGATVLANACGPCIGQWQRTDVQPGAGAAKGENAILTSFNRNFKARNDGNAKTLNFLASPELVAAKIYSTDLAFDPTRDAIPLENGKQFRFAAPQGIQLPSSGFEVGDASYLPASVPEPESSVQIKVDPESDRLELLTPFPPFAGPELDLKVVVKVKGKCTTDHISAAGSWLKYKGHLTNICRNTLIGAVNAETGETNKAYDVDGTAMTIPELMESWRQKDQPWMIVAEHNYGEGSAREHAALQPRALNGRIILCKSFARIHETNLKKQGILPLTFKNESDYDLISACDSVQTQGLADLVGEQAENASISLLVTKRDGSHQTIPVQHTMSSDQIAFFKSGSALNLISSRAKYQARL